MEAATSGPDTTKASSIFTEAHLWKSRQSALLAPSCHFSFRKAAPLMQLCHGHSSLHRSLVEGLWAQLVGRISRFQLNHS